MKVITGFNNYSVTKEGDVYNNKTNRKLKSSCSPKGYSFIELCRPNEHKIKTIHRIVWETYIGVIPDNIQINHIDGNKSNNSLSNLELVTGSENLKKAVIEGLIKSGYNNPYSKSVDKFDIKGNYITTYGSLSLASKHENIQLVSISLCCSGKQNTTRGFIFKYSQEK